MATQLKWRLLLAAAATVAGSSLAPSLAQAQPADYVRICDALGAGWYYEPGSGTCINADTGATGSDDGVVTGVTDAVGAAYEGIAISLATPNATVDDGKSFGANLNVGAFAGAVAIGVGAAISPGKGLTFNASIGLGLQHGTAAAHVGLSQSW
jgi:hypothetical protein